MIKHILLHQLSKQLIQDLDRHSSIALNKHFVLALNYEIRPINLNSSKQNNKIFLNSPLGRKKVVIGIATTQSSVLANPVKFKRLLRPTERTAKVNAVLLGI